MSAFSFIGVLVLLQTVQFWHLPNCFLSFILHAFQFHISGLNCTISLFLQALFSSLLIFHIKRVKDISHTCLCFSLLFFLPLIFSCSLFALPFFFSAHSPLPTLTCLDLLENLLSYYNASICPCFLLSAGSPMIAIYATEQNK